MRIRYSETYINYKSIDDMSKDILRNLHKFPHDVDLIVGIPRSGMLPANLLALYLQKPYTDIDSFVDGRIYDSGFRVEQKFKDKNIKRILIVDDSINLGIAQNKVRQKLKNHTDFDFIFSAIYATSDGSKMVDCYAEIVDMPRIFEWNFFHHAYMHNACFDMDGVLCLDPPIDDDGPKYLDYITNAIPYIIPTEEINTIVTCRLEKYRKPTEEWLRRYNIRYKRLIMLPFNTKEERIKWGRHAYYKAKEYKNSDCTIFVESSKYQAETIYNESGKFVFCIETFSPMVPAKKIDKKYYLRAIVNKLISPFTSKRI